MVSLSFRKRISLLLGTLCAVSLMWWYQSEVLGVSLAKASRDEHLITRVEVPDMSRDLLWKQASTSAPWAARDSHAAFFFNDKVWIAGGISGNGLVSGAAVKYWEFPHFNDVWNSSDGITWEKAADKVAWPPRRSMSIIEHQGKLWMFGGWSPIGGYQNDIWVSADGVLWRRVVENAPWSEREGQITLIWNNKIFMFGGVNYDLRTTFNDVWSSEDGITWKQEVAHAAWSPRWDHSISDLGGTLYLTAGMTIGGATFRDVWSSKDGVHWELVTNTPPWESRQGHALLRYRGKLWLVGRLNDKDDEFGSNDVWFSENGNVWEKVDTDPQWLGREDFAGFVYRGKMWVNGGMDVNKHWNNDIWYAEL